MSAQLSATRTTNACRDRSGLACLLLAEFGTLMLGYRTREPFVAAEPAWFGRPVPAAALPSETTAIERFLAS